MTCHDVYVNKPYVELCVLKEINPTNKIHAVNFDIFDGFDFMTHEQGDNSNNMPPIVWDRRIYRI